jgi:predicted nucleotidyltransferase component of viral defense system
MRLQETRRRLGIPWEVLERDYLLSWILAGIAQVEPLREHLVFKGGTALKKCYFREYRFSEDLDFSALPGLPQHDALEAAMTLTCKAAARLLDEYAPVEIACERYTETTPHPSGQEAFTIRARFPWHRHMHTRAMVEVCVDEAVLQPIQRRAIVHEYGEELKADLQVYSLEEIIAEKLRAILQHIETLQQRGWSRSRARDYYDLWRILGDYGGCLRLKDFATTLARKCAARQVAFNGPDAFFEPAMLAYVQKTWQQWLGPLVPQLPAFDRVMGELRSRIEKLLRSD